MNTFHLITAERVEEENKPSVGETGCSEEFDGIKRERRTMPGRDHWEETAGGICGRVARIEKLWQNSYGHVRGIWKYFIARFIIYL